ncbi:MAG: AraC family transcriptional regulator [Clostridia bacterium]|nr:AraC family transcriptional regulator [Clostridia bacterium]
MEWLTCIKSAIGYIEDHLTDICIVEEVAQHVHISPMYLQKGFQIMTGYTIGEYIRNRRLYNAALDIAGSADKIIDIAYKYGYETPESFTKAFTRYHDASPSDIRKNRYLIKAFHPLRISIVIQGGAKMDFSVKKMAGFKVIGFARNFSFDSSYADIPLFWDEVFKKYAQTLYSGNAPTNETEQAVIDNRIGEFGVCIDDIGENGQFRYMIAGKYMGGNVPEGMEIYELPDMEWARFRCIGPMPDSMQSVNTQIWKEWLPGNKEYELAGRYNIEWYSSAGNTTDADYQSEIWIPVTRKA